MKLFKKALAGVAVAAAFAAPAQASTVALADMFINSLGLVAIDNSLTSLTITSEGRTGTASSNYNGVDGTGTGASSISSPATGATVDVQNRCAGDCVGAALLYTSGLENNFTEHLSTPGTVNFAMGDMYIGGLALSEGGVQGLTRANAMTSSATNGGAGNATILNTGSITGTFLVGTTFTGSVAVGANYWLQAFVDSLLPSKGSASAGFGWNMSIECTTNCADGWTDLFFRPGDLNRSISSRDITENRLFSNAGFTALSDVRTYLAGTSYNFTINQSSNAIVSEIPEPESLALVGLGLLGLAAARRRKAVK